MSNDGTIEGIEHFESQTEDITEENIDKYEY